MERRDRSLPTSIRQIRLITNKNTRYMELKPVKEMTYREAITQLESILRMMQGDDCDIDKLTSMTRRATELIAECRSRLVATDEELRSILADLDK